MRLVRLGRRIINLEYLIMYEDGAEPGSVRMVLETGIVLDLPPPEGDTLKRLTADLIFTDRPPNPDAVGRAVTSEAGTSARRRRGSER